MARVTDDGTPEGVTLRDDCERCGEEYDRSSELFWSDFGDVLTCDACEDRRMQRAMVCPAAAGC